jgi:hypothetical protein
MSTESRTPTTTSSLKNVKESVSKSSSKLNIVGFTTFTLFLLGAYSIGGQVGTQRAINDTLKLCNQNVGECVFKYDILMYNETGKVPPNMRSTPSTKPVVKP